MVAVCRFIAGTLTAAMFSGFAQRVFADHLCNPVTGKIRPDSRNQP